MSRASRFVIALGVFLLVPISAQAQDAGAIAGFGGVSISGTSTSNVPDVGGNLKSFRAGQVHRMALEESMLDHFTGGILNKYSEEDTDPIYWAVWTDLVSG